MTTGRFFVEDKAQWSRALLTVDLWSAFTSLTITAAATTRALPSITIADLPAGVTLARAAIFVKFRTLSEHLSADADLLNDQQIQIRKAVDGTWLTGMTLLNGQLICPADAREFGDVLIGSVDVKAQIPANGAIAELQWANSRVSAGEIHLEDLQTGLRIWFSVV